MIDSSYRHFHWSSSLLSALPKLAPYLLGVLVVALVGTSSGNSSSTTFAVLSIGGIIVVTVAKFYTERFRIDKENLVRKSGLFKTTTTSLPYDRIVSINTTQTSLQRYLGLVTLQVQAASESAIELPGVRQAVYDELDAHIKSFDDRSGTDTAEVATDSNRSNLEWRTSDAELHRMSLLDCLKLGLVRNIALVAIFTFVLAIYRHLAERHSNIVGSYLERITGVSVLDWHTYFEIELTYAFFPWIAVHLNHDVNWGPPLAWLSILCALFVLVVTVCSFVLLWFMYSGFRISVSEEHIRISTSSFVATNRKIPFKKIQFVRTIRTLRHRLLNSESVSFYTTSLSYLESRFANRLGNWLVPIGRPVATKRVVARVFNHNSLDEGSWRGAVASSWRRRLKKHLTIWLPINCVLVLIAPVLLILGLLSLPLLVFEARKFVAGIRYRLTSDAILMERGWWIRSSTVIPLRKIQSVRLSQSYFDDRHQVATLSIWTAGGSFRYATASVPYVSYSEALAVSSAIFAYLRQHQFDG